MQLFSANRKSGQKKTLKKWASKVPHNRPRPFYFTGQPRPQPTAQKWFFILWNLGTRHLFSYLCLQLDPLWFHDFFLLFSQKFDRQNICLWCGNFRRHIAGSHSAKGKNLITSSSHLITNSASANLKPVHNCSHTFIFFTPLESNTLLPKIFIFPVKKYPKLKTWFSFDALIVFYQ